MLTVTIFDDVEQTRDGDEYRVWHVSLMDDDGEPAGHVYTFTDEDEAWRFGPELARRHRVRFDGMD